MPGSPPLEKRRKIIAYLKAFGEKHKLETLIDEAGNVLIKKLQVQAWKPENSRSSIACGHGMRKE